MTEPGRRVEDAGELPGVPDAFQRLWTPHRMVYIGGENKPADDSAPRCPFCRSGAEAYGPGQESLVVHRGERCFVVLNLYPYNPGHLLVCPLRHVAGYPELTREETLELAELTQSAMRVLREVSGPAGFNLGMNQGPVAGAGIAAHLHQHVVPRWGGDANFLPIVAQTKAVPQLLAQTRDLLAAAWPGSADPGLDG